MLTETPSVAVGAPRPAGLAAAKEVIDRTDRNRWSQHLGQIATYYPLARPRIPGGDSIPALALKSRAPLPYATTVSGPEAFGRPRATYQQEAEGRSSGGAQIA